MHKEQIVCKCKFRSVGTSTDVYDRDNFSHIIRKHTRSVLLYTALLSTLHELHDRRKREKGRVKQKVRQRERYTEREAVRQILI